MERVLRIGSVINDYQAVSTQEKDMQEVQEMHEIDHDEIAHARATRSPKSARQGRESESPLSRANTNESIHAALGSTDLSEQPDLHTGTSICFNARVYKLCEVTHLSISSRSLIM